MASVFPVIFLLIVALALIACAWFFTPKGPNQIVVRTSVMLTLTCCYLMWMVTYMAQLHPLIGPVKSLKSG